MFLIFTKDIMFLQGIHHLIKKEDFIHIQRVEDFIKIGDTGVKVIIDTFNNNIFYTSMACELERIKPERIFIISPFRIKRCFGDIPVSYITRNVTLSDFNIFINSNEGHATQPKLSFTRRQHLILTRIYQQKPCDLIAKEMNISLKTYYCHRYNIMLILKLRKMSGLLHHQVSLYLK